MSQLTELASKVFQILNANTEAPADALIREGTAIVKIGEALKDLSDADAVKVIESAAALAGVGRARISESTGPPDRQT